MGLSELQAMYAKDREANQKEKIAFLREELRPLALELKELDEEKAMAEMRLKELKDKISEAEDKIRRIWLPHIAGAEKAMIDLDGIGLKTEPILKVSYEEDVDKDKAMAWMMNNGYKEIMKYQCHMLTLYSIARELYRAKEPKLIEGLDYNYFQVVKLTK